MPESNILNSVGCFVKHFLHLDLVLLGLCPSSGYKIPGHSLNALDMYFTCSNFVSFDLNCKNEV